MVYSNRIRGGPDAKAGIAPHTRQWKEVVVLRTVLRLGAVAVEETAKLIDAEACAILAAERVVETVPTVPRRAARVVSDAVTVLAQINPRDPHPWHAFRSRFTIVHRLHPQRS